jgi:hypothetical protein
MKELLDYLCDADFEMEIASTALLIKDISEDELKIKNDSYDKNEKQVQDILDEIIRRHRNDNG